MQQLGIPSKLAPVLFAQALSRLFLVYSAYAVILAELLLLVIAVHEQNWTFVAAGVAIGMPGFVLWRVMFTPMSPLTVALYIGTLGTSLAFATWVVFTNTDQVDSTMFLPLTLVGFALVTASGAATRTGDRLAWAAVGYVVANIATFAGAVVAGGTYAFDIRLLIGYVIVCIAIIATPRLLEANTKFQVTFDRSAEEIATDAERSVQARAVAAELHDTVLANLAVISATKPGMLQDPLREALQSQLAVLESNTPVTWSATQVPGNTAEDHPDVISEVISKAEASGLSVNLSGDPGVLNLLSGDHVEALVGALSQCLTNVKRHSGQNAVEVVILNAGENITITVIDGGSGFEVDAIPEDRMGLKLSVRDRIEQCGGTVRIWSSEGQGTAVMLQLPVERGDTDA
ncbi:signal transduction histidine kinase [Aurantimicrobium minutum]|uniref:sensor histidine kinase n=1 Tax=Aurantimicrobium minutum TaxID=708131 RepID=UPI002473DB77|nr:ATP-binding protein [Aurantimicrobium minutum]MDH6531894.1 signal transduction histidine kinase [Aurantimicrobium minutum]